MEIRNLLREKALEIVKHRDRELLKRKNEEGIVLDERFQKDCKFEFLQMVIEYYKTKGREEETVDDYVLRYDKLVKQFRRENKHPVKGEIKGL